MYEAIIKQNFVNKEDSSIEYLKISPQSSLNSRINCFDLSVESKTGSILKSKSNLFDFYPFKFLNKRICHSTDNLETLQSFYKFPLDESQEILLKSYKCALSLFTGINDGKLLISNNFLCFTRKAGRRLIFVVKLKEIDSFNGSKMDRRIQLRANGKLFELCNIRKFDSCFGFLSNYIEIIQKENRVDTFLFSRKATEHHSGSMPTTNFVLLPNASDMKTNSSIPLMASHSNFSADGNPSATSTNSSFSLSPSLEKFVITSPQSNLKSRCERNSNDDRLSPDAEIAVSKQSQSQSSKGPDQRSHSDDTATGGLLTCLFGSVLSSILESTVSSGVSALSCAAFQVTCIPASLLLRAVSSQHLSEATSRRLFDPPRPFMVVLTYVILAFLAVSMAYLFYQIDSLPSRLLPLKGLHQSASSIECSAALQNIVSQLNQVSLRMSSLLKSTSPSPGTPTDTELPYHDPTD